MIGIVCRDWAYMKLLHSICLELHNLGATYNLYLWDAYRSEKEYNRSSLSNIKKSSPEVIKHASKVRTFKADKQLLTQMAHDKITKMVSVEIWMWAKNYLKQLKTNNIKTYSVQYLSDSIWQPNQFDMGSLNRIYYTTEYLMNTHHEFSGIQFNPKRDRYFGSPIFDCINPIQNGDDILVLLPNLRAEHVAGAFGSADKFISIIKEISKHGDLILKTRKKQWLPDAIRPLAKEILDDGDQMYPSVVSKLLPRCSTSVMFYSSGIFEAVYGGNFVHNIILPLKRWGWDKIKMKNYFSDKEGSLYQYKGVVESITQKDVLGGKFKKKSINPEMRGNWVKQFIGTNKNSSLKIAHDILGG